MHSKNSSPWLDGRSGICGWGLCSAARQRPAEGWLRPAADQTDWSGRGAESDRASESNEASAGGGWNGRIA